MMRQIYRHPVFLAIFVVAVLSIAVRAAEVSSPESGSAASDAALRARVKEGLARATRWLKTQQQEDGSFVDTSIVNDDGSIGSQGIQPALTGLVVYGIAKSPLAEELRETDMMKRAVAYIKRHVHPDGGIYEQAFASTYQTSVCLSALATLKDPANAPTVAAAQRYLKSLQADQQVGVARTQASYGGWGYSADTREADLSNLQFALTALKESGVTAHDAVWEKALQFVERCQNIKVDGGFIYRPGESKAGVDEKGNYRSYLSMTYAGLLSFIYCNVRKDDPRVRAAVEWLRKHYNLEDNVPIGKQGLFYSYHTMAKALIAYGERAFADSTGQKHDWFQELASTLLEKQRTEGFWVNTSNRWFETDKVLVTAYVILALSEGYAASP